MRAITEISKISPISILMVGFTGRLRTSLCCLRPCMGKLVLPHVFVSGGLSDILRRLSVAFIAAWVYV